MIVIQHLVGSFHVTSSGIGRLPNKSWSHFQAEEDPKSWKQFLWFHQLGKHRKTMGKPYENHRKPGENAGLPSGSVK